MGAWFDLDPDAKCTWSGPITGVGAEMSRAGSSSTGVGGQEIAEARLTTTSSARSTSEVAKLRSVIAGWRKAKVSVWPGADSVRGYNPINRWFGALPFDRMAGKDYEKNPGELKAVLESSRASKRRR